VCRHALQGRERRGAVREHRAEFAVEIEIGLPAIERADRGGDVRISGRPVEPIARQQRGPAFDNPRMDAEAVELDVMRPTVAVRNLRHQLAQFRLDPLRRRRKVRDHVLRRGTDSTLHIPHDANALRPPIQSRPGEIRSSSRRRNPATLAGAAWRALL
jgi:hypothetical protein